uniref:Putative PKD domain protein n=1 Tax=uncultured marine microorganism HF4000_APKG10F13 TaxID=455557 RepID=B3TBT4_9ZZZZ|nr:putative PKD domain protein [uncultured marine microorganism HF4000_APKG10F13]
MQCMRQFALLLLPALLLFLLPAAEAVPPEAVITGINPQEAESEDTIEFMGEFSDDDGDDLDDFYWNSSLDGTIHSGNEAGGLLFQMAADQLSSGNHTITLQVRTNSSEWSGNATSWLNITEPEAQPPEAHIILNPPQVNQGEEVSFIAGDPRAYDPAMRVTEFNWTVQWEGESEREPLSAEESFTRSSFWVGNHTIYLTVTDDQGTVSREFTAMLTVLPPRPLAEIVASSTAPKEGQMLYLEAVCRDQQLEVIVCQAWEWMVVWHNNGTLRFTLSGQNHTVENLTEGAYQLRLRVTNDGTDSQWEVLMLYVQPPNQNPSRSIDISPASLGSSRYYQHQNLTFTADASDSDGYVTGYAWWFSDEMVSTSPSWIHSFSTPGGPYHVKLNVQDNDGAWSGNKSVSVYIVANTPPTVSISLNLEQPRVDDTLQLSGSASDSEGYVASWVWYLDGVLAAQTQNLTLVLNETGDRIVTLHAYDDGGLMGQASASFSVLAPDTSDEKRLSVEVSPHAADVGALFTIDLRNTTGPVLDFEINFGGEIFTTSERLVKVSFNQAGIQFIDVEVHWSDGTPFDGSRDSFSTEVTVTKPASGGDTGGDEDGDGGGLPGPGLLAALAGLGLAARRRQR